MESPGKPTRWVYCECCNREVQDIGAHKKSTEHQLNGLFQLKKKIRSEDHIRREITTADARNRRSHRGHVK